jgi:DNA primase
MLEPLAASYAQASSYISAYLAGRGIDGATAAQFRLGYVAQATPGAGDDDYVGRMSIPYETPSGTVDIRYRALHSTGPKYLSRPGSRARLYNVGDLRKVARRICICEGELDTIITSALCGVPAVGVPGANAWQPHFPYLFEHYERVYVLADGDTAGRDFGKRVASQVERAVVINMPEGMDVNDCFLAEGAEGIRRRVGISE